MATQTWKVQNFASTDPEDDNVQDAVNFLDQHHQGPGEALVTVRESTGRVQKPSVTLFYLDPGSRGDDTSHKWAFMEFNGTAANQDDAVNFLNSSPSRMGPGEASAGTVGVMYYDVGSLDSLDSPTWGYTNFPAGTGPGEGPNAVTFALNGAPRQGAGEVCAIPRNDGPDKDKGLNPSVGVFAMNPGSIDFMAWPTWQYRNFGSQQDAVKFLNAAPARQGGTVRLGPGEATAWARGDNTVGVFYLERGPG